MSDVTESALTLSLRADLTEAMKARDELRTATIRMVLTAIKAESVSGATARELSDDEVLAVLRREAKKRREAATAFDDGGRPERAERERAEQAVIDTYLPSQLSDEELGALVATAVAAAASEGKTGMSAMGAVMKAANAAVAGRAEGGRVAAEVKRLLQG